MTRLVLLLALLATPALADEVCDASAVEGSQAYPIVETSALMEALQDFPLAKHPTRVTEATHHALLDSTVYSPTQAWTVVRMLDEELENQGVFSPSVAMTMLERRLDEEAHQSQQSIDMLSHQIHSARRDYAAIRQGLRRLAAEEPPVSPRAGIIPGLASLANLFNGRKSVVRPQAEQLSSWRRAQLMRRQALQQEQAEVLSELTELHNALQAELARRDLHLDAADNAASIGCGLEWYRGDDVVQF